MPYRLIREFGISWELTAAAHVDPRLELATIMEGSMTFSEQSAIAMLKSGASFKEAAEVHGLEVTALMKLWEAQKRQTESKRTA